jgi:hypothetical protein
MDKERAAKAMADPEIQAIMMDPIVRQTLSDMSTDPTAASRVSMPFKSYPCTLVGACAYCSRLWSELAAPGLFLLLMCGPPLRMCEVSLVLAR